jgi:hypothetical protein
MVDAKVEMTRVVAWPDSRLIGFATPPASGGASAASAPSVSNCHKKNLLQPGIISTRISSFIKSQNNSIIHYTQPAAMGFFTSLAKSKLTRKGTAASVEASAHVPSGNSASGDNSRGASKASAEVTDLLTSCFDDFDSDGLFGIPHRLSCQLTSGR